MHSLAYCERANTSIIDGSVKKGDKIKLYTTGKDYEVTEVGVFTPKLNEREKLLLA